MCARSMLKVMSVAALLAVSANQGRAACLNPPASDQAISLFKSNPKGLIAPGTDTRTIEASVRDLAGTDASLAAMFVSVAEGATPRFQTAIAAGLAQAAIACTNADQQAALLIQQAVAGFDDGQFQASFAAVAGDLSTAATDAAASYASSSAGSVVVTNPNTSNGSKASFGGGGGGGLAAFLLAPSQSTTAADAVSATR
jgi:hypothetical protein